MAKTLYSQRTVYFGQMIAEGLQGLKIISADVTQSRVDKKLLAGYVHFDQEIPTNQKITLLEKLSKYMDCEIEGQRKGNYLFFWNVSRVENPRFQVDGSRVEMKWHNI